ncbi:KEOPS complex subunit Cgi121 [Geoglobus acetivorans]|uniref:Kinase binding protein CGI-121 n=1 Tax=Geoglobus acetivorans TaxID=565033 RepID=A0A0A7GF02_GEOAI|nr:hypothetical protein GACE_1611 [Geoglobus acetivorans]
MRLYQGEIYVEDVKEFLKKLPDGCVLVNADYVADIKSLEFAVNKALKSWREGRRISRSLSMEILLHISATRQINRAVTIGVGEGENRVIVVDLNDCAELLRKYGFREGQVLQMDEEKVSRLKEFYEITDEELDVVGVKKLGMLVRERMALFAASK